MSTEGGTKAIVAALAANLGIAVTKFVAFLLTGVQLDARRVGALGRRLRQPGAAAARRQARLAGEATPQHPFGYGRERYVYAFIVSIVLFSVGGLFALYEAWHKCAARREPIEADWWWVPVVGAGRRHRHGGLLLPHRDPRVQPRPGAGGRWLEFVRTRQGARAAGGPARGLRRADRPGLRPVRRRADPAHRRTASGTRSAPRSIGVLLVVVAVVLGDRDEVPAARRGRHARGRAARSREALGSAAPASTASSTCGRCTSARRSCWSRPRSRWRSRTDGRRRRGRDRRRRAAGSARPSRARPCDLPRAGHRPRRRRPRPTHAWPSLTAVAAPAR